MRTRAFSRFLVVTSSLASLLVATGASAAPIAVNFTGTMEFIDGIFEPDFPGISVGSVFSGSLVVDPASVTSSNDAGPWKTYSLSVLSGSLVMEGHTFQLASNDIFIQNAGLDLWQIDAGPTEFGLIFADSTGSVLSSTDLFVPATLAGWESARVSWSDFPDGASGMIETIEVVPEPSAALLLALGLAGLATRRSSTDSP